MKNEKRYTMKEFREMFNIAEMKAIEEMSNQMAKAQEDGRKDPMMAAMLSMQNMIFAAEIAKNLFKED